MEKARKNRKSKTLIRIGIIILSILTIFVLSLLYSRSWKNAFFINPIYKLHTSQKLVALTFDDGPSNTRTLPLLELLDKYNIKATFFMLGENIEKYPTIAKTVYDKEHLIGNHSYNHPRLIFKSPSFIKSQITN